MFVRRYQLSFTTPAFLGNAGQDAQWRTPPIKALLRQWWRVAWAAEREFALDLAAMREQEGRLLGHAWLENDAAHARKSAVRLRLSRWDDGKLERKAWRQEKFKTVKHPQVRQPVAADLYLGYGPVIFDKANRTSALKAKAAIQAGEHAGFSIAFAPLPGTSDEKKKCAEKLLSQALGWMDRFGTLGGRSRNGWGSLHLQPEQGTPPLESALPLRPWEDALKLDWPHAIGQDDKGPLIWQTQAFGDWRAVMVELTHIKIGLRTQFRFNSGNGAPRPEDRHWLSYPVTSHSVNSWDHSARLPNSLRLKVRASGGKLVGEIFHMPCLPPASFKPDADAIADVWQKVHHFLDKQPELRRTR
nr:RAMP superfamily CRISPR-associated protein [uncultured Ottowia sp.]